MKERKKTVVILISSLVLLIFGIYFAYYRAKASAKLTSCTNHVIQLKFIFLFQLKNSDGLIQLPYDKNLPGYAVIAKINHGTPGPWVNCNHGNPNGWYGGWQYINLPMETLYKLSVEWKKKNPDKNMPILWCGKGSDLDRCSLDLMSISKVKKGIDISLLFGSVNKTDIESLNDCLKTIGENTVSFDIPDGIDWSKYKKKLENKEKAWGQGNSH